MNKIALITGASSGIGKATAIALADQNINLILCGRREDKLKELQVQLANKVKSVILCFDVSKFDEVSNAMASLAHEWQNIDILINNAGNAHGLSTIQDGQIVDWESMIGSNISGLLNVSKLVLQGMVKRCSGHVVNISSIAGKQTYANAAVYCATKKSVEAISEGMRLDLNPFGIKVTNIAPGAVETEFSVVRFKGDAERAAKVYEGFEPLVANDIANAIVYCLMAPAHVMIADMTILPTAQAGPTTINRK